MVQPTPIYSAPIQSHSFYVSEMQIKRVQRETWICETNRKLIKNGFNIYPITAKNHYNLGIFGCIEKITIILPIKTDKVWVIYHKKLHIHLNLNENTLHLDSKQQYFIVYIQVIIYITYLYADDNINKMSSSSSTFFIT